MSANDELWFNAPGDFSGERSKILLEQYKLYVESSAKVSDRRGAANTFLLTANTALVTVYGLVAGRDIALGAVAGPWRWLIPLAGLTLCLAWFAGLRAYRTLNKAKFAVIHEFERHLPARPFDLEWRHLSRGKFWLYTPLTHVEQLVPAVFAAIYVGLTIVTTAPAAAPGAG